MFLLLDLYYMSSIHLQQAFLKKLSVIPLMSYCNSNVNGHLVILEEIVFSLLNKLNPYPEIGNLALFLSPVAYGMWLEKISVDFASSSLEVPILYIRFSSTTIKAIKQWTWCYSLRTFRVAFFLQVEFYITNITGCGCHPGILHWGATVCW